MQDCYEAGLKTAMVARSPTYIFPYDYMMDPHGIGAYDLMPLDAADKMLNALPSALNGQFSPGYSLISPPRNRKSSSFLDPTARLHINRHSLTHQINAVTAI